MQQAQLVKQFLQFLQAPSLPTGQAESPNVFSNMAIDAEVLHYQKHDFVFRQGEAVHNLWFVAYGLLRYVAVSDDGKEFTKHFSKGLNILG